ncbi:MAG: pilus assembly protein PilM [Planctomycetota bacterium]|nr:pilus assembly protein PilM [Planctomycetota bacterium]
MLFPSKNLLGIEIGGQYLKIVHFNNKNEILHWTSTDIRVLTDEGTIDFIRNYLLSNKIKTVDVINSIPARYTITKNIELPSTDPAEMRQIIKLQAGHHSPYSADEIVIDYIPIGVFKGGYTRVFLIIVNRDNIKRNFDIIERAGLRLKKTTLSLETLSLWYKERSTLGTSGILHLDADNTDFLVLREQKPIFLRNIPVGIEQLLFDKERFLQQFLEEINHSLEAYQTEQLEPLSKIIACGATSKAEEFIRAIPERNTLSVTMEDIFEGIKTHPLSADIKGNTSGLSVLSLASAVIKQNKIQIDLTPEEAKLREAVTEKSRDIIWMGTLVFFIMILLISIFAQKIWMRNKTVDVLTKENLKYAAESSDLKNTRQKLKEVKTLLSRRYFALDALLEVHKHISPEIYLTSMVFDDSKERKDQNKMTLDGIAFTKDDAINFGTRLEGSEYFKLVNPPDVTSRRERVKGIEREMVEFKIVCAFEK